MTLRELAQLLDQEAFWLPSPGVRIPVRILDVAPERFGRVDVTVTPVGGQGSLTVSLDKLELEENDDHPRRPNPVEVSGLPLR